MKISLNYALSAGMLSIFVAICLTLLKLYAWVDEQAVSVLASLTDSLVDIFASIVSFIAIKIALSPADNDHNFGHEKAESLSALMQSAFIVGSAVMLIVQSVERLANPIKLESIIVSSEVMVVATIMTIGLVMYQRWVVKKTGSIAVKADSAHYVGDLLANVAVFVALAASTIGWFWLDPLVALVIVVILFYSAFDILKEALYMLMDQALPVEDVDKMKALILSFDGVLGIHDLKTRKSGKTEFIQLHVEMSAKLLLIDAHDLGEEIEESIKRVYPNSDVLIHHDPVT
jgi:ferrous-iron efflux pump FieF